MTEIAQRPMLTRIGLIATDPVRIAGIRALCSAEMGAGSGYELVRLSGPHSRKAEALRLALIDASATERLLGLLVAFRRHKPELRLVILGAVPDEDLTERLLAAGAKGVLGDDATGAELRQAIRVGDEGSLWAPRKVLARLLDRVQEFRPNTLAAVLPFTRRESDVLRLLAQGQPNRDIARALGVEEDAVKAHVGRLMRKVGVANRTALVLRIHEQHLA